MIQGTQITCTNGSYEIVGQIGRGSYGIVYKAISLSDNKIVAIKTPANKDNNYNRYSTQKKQKAIDKIRNEIKQLQKFGKQAEKNHIVPLLDWHYGADDHPPIMVMPLSEGTLSHYVRDTGEAHRFTCDEFLALIEQMLIALSFIHQKAFNVIHRDVKLNNFLLINKKVYLCDFGEGKEPKHDWTTSVAGTVIFGAPELFIPEKIESGDPKRRVTHKVDIYSVGLIIYNLIMFAGNYPKAQSKLYNLTDEDGGCRENAPESFQKVGGLEDHEKTSCIKYLSQLAQKNALPFPNEFVQAFMRFLEQLLCPIIDDRLDAPGSLKQLKRLKDIIHPQIIQFEVNCPETVCINTSYVMTINARYKGLPFISKWLTIQDKTHNNTIEITEIKKTDKNQYQVTLPGMAHEGRYQLSIIPFDPAYTKICQIQIHITPE
ncbi:Serine/threonine protein kinase domain protein, partial [Candidatus Magnetomorum sp. HK-1]